MISHGDTEAQRKMKVKEGSIMDYHLINFPTLCLCASVAFFIEGIS